MAMFGNSFRPRGFVGEIEPGSAPAVDPMGIMPGDQPMPPTMQPSGGMFGKMRKGWNSGGWQALGHIGAQLLAANGNPIGQAVLGYQDFQRQREEDEYQNLYRAALARKALEGDETYTDVTDPQTGRVIGQRGSRSNKFNPITPSDGRTALQQNWDWFNGLTPEQQKQARLMMPGAAYDLSVQQPIIAARTAAQIDAKAAPTFSATGGGRVNHTTALKDAAAAIAKGADRAAVVARLESMGIDPRGL